MSKKEFIAGMICIVIFVLVYMFSGLLPLNSTLTLTAKRIYNIETKIDDEGNVEVIVNE